MPPNVDSMGTHTPSCWRASISAWFDSHAAPVEATAEKRIEWLRAVPFFGLHISCIAALWVGVSPLAVALATALFVLRMFAITGFYHRYFSHRAFRAGRLTQFLFALLGASAAQRGPLWWASQHRHHHVHSDDEHDAHSPRRHGFLWSHTGWFLARENFATRWELVGDFAKFPELRWLDRYDVLVPVLLGVALYALGVALEHWAPGLGTNGVELVVWGFCISTVVLYHATFAVNSLAHIQGKRRYATRDDSRNSWWLALVTFGEGWHNNHHHFPGSARQGFYWWEVDVTYYVLGTLAVFGVIWDLRPVPAALVTARRITSHRDEA
jgi:stearoyl-CoA desaturase (Delta-9 desaturase)